MAKKRFIDWADDPNQAQAATSGSESVELSGLDSAAGPSRQTADDGLDAEQLVDGPGEVGKKKKKKRKKDKRAEGGGEWNADGQAASSGESRKKSKRDHPGDGGSIPIHPSLRAPEPAAASSNVPAQPLNLAEVLNMALHDDQQNQPAATADQGLTQRSSTGGLDLSQVSQEELLAALRQINPDLIIHDPTTTAAAASSSSARAQQQQPVVDLPAFTNAPSSSKQPAKSKIVSAANDPVIDPAFVKAAAGGKSSLSEALLQSLAGMTYGDVLATKWLNATQLNELAEAYGVDFKKGQFSATEKAAVDAAIADYQSTHNLDLAALRAVIFAKGKKERNEHADFFPTVTSSLGGRPVIAVYNYVRRAFDPLAKKGPWRPEEDAALADAVATHGARWGEISNAVGRTKGDCRDRWRNHVSVRATKVTGSWSLQEEDDLRDAVHSVTTGQGRSPDQEVFWSAVSAKLGGRRSRAQCRIKWLDSMNPREKNNGEAVIWKHRDSLILAQRLLELGMTDDTGFDWRKVEDGNWGRGWSAHTLQTRWRKLKNLTLKDPSVQGKPLPELIEIIVDRLAAKSDAQLDAATKVAKTPGLNGED